MLEEYFLLVRRIPGISMSVQEFWELDTFTTQKLLDLEKEIMKEEQKGADGKSRHEYSEYHEDNAPEMDDIVNQMQEDG